MKASFKDLMNYWQTFFLLFAVFVYVFAATFLDIPKENQRTVDTVIGFLLGSVLGTIVAYKYGTTSAKKAEEAKALNTEETK